MYASFYGCDQAPFDTSPRPDALFETPTHNEALASVVYGVLEAKGFVVLLGEVGVGKTSVLRRAMAYVGSMDPAILMVEIAEPALAPATLVARLAAAIEPKDGRSGARPDDPLALAMLESGLRRVAEGGRRLVVVLDEAQGVESSTLELLRILSSLDGGGRPLVQIVLCGQPELEVRLRDPALRALRQRIAVRAWIRPLTRREMGDYLAFRLARVGARPADVMSRPASRRIAGAARGLPRRANVIADNALMAGYGAGRMRIGRAEVARALDAIDGGRGLGRRLGGWRLAAGSVGLAALLGLGWLAAPAIGLVGHGAVAVSASVAGAAR